MKHFLKRRWFLLLLIGGVGLALACPERLQPFTGRLPPLLLVGPALFLVAWSLESDRLWRALIRPRPVMWAILISYGLVPALGCTAGRFLSNPDLAIGLMLITSVPCTLASAVLWTRMAGGNEAVALLTILGTTATSWLVTPAWLFLTTRTRVNLDPLGMMMELLLVLVVPVGLGQLTRAVGPLGRFAQRNKTGLGIFSQTLILVVLLKAAVDFRISLDKQDTISGIWFLATGLICMGIHGTALAVGFWSSQRWGFDKPSQIAVAFAGSQKTLPVALFLLETHFRDYPLAVVPMVFYHAGQLIFDTFIAEKWAARWPGEKDLDVAGI
jgi:solute carrier family 10 (sodium/bile acid cotransporter), member 7